MLYYPAHGSGSSLQARLMLTGRLPGPFTGLTNPVRQYFLQPAANLSVTALHRKDFQLGTGQKLFFRLGPDLPKGQYRLTVKEMDNKPGYIQLYRIRPGAYDKRSLGRELP